MISNNTFLSIRLGYNKNHIGAKIAENDGPDQTPLTQSASVLAQSRQPHSLRLQKLKRKYMISFYQITYPPWIYDSSGGLMTKPFYG